MKRNNKRGFTIVELVVVIAVIAILAAILIPTFSGVTKNAQEAARDQEAKTLYSQYLANWDYESGEEPAAEGYFEVDDYIYIVEDGNVKVDGNQAKDTETGTLTEIDLTDTGVTEGGSAT